MKSPRPPALQGTTYEQTCGCGKLFVVCNDHLGELFEVFVRLGKSGSCGAAMANSTAVSTSVALRSGADPRDLAKGLMGIQCHKGNSCMEAIGRAIKGHVSSPRPSRLVAREKRL